MRHLPMTNRHRLTGVILLLWLAACSAEPISEAQSSGDAAANHVWRESSNAPLTLTYFRLAN